MSPCETPCEMRSALIYLIKKNDVNILPCEILRFFLSLKAMWNNMWNMDRKQRHSTLWNTLWNTDDNKTIQTFS